MKPAPFVYHSPTNLDEALGLLEEYESEAKVLAGGQSLVPVLNMRLAGPSHLIDINRLPGLDQVTVVDGEVRIGALVRHAQLMADEKAVHALPLIGQAMPWVAHPAIRNRGTTVGSIVHADPSGEMPTLLALTGGRVVLRSVDGERTVDASDFFIGPMESDIEPHELAVEVVLPVLPPGTRTAFTELARRHGDYAMAGVALAVRAGDDGRMAGGSASFVSLTPTPDVLDLTPELAGCGPDEADSRVEAVMEAVSRHVDPHDDIHASAEYRRHLAAVLTKRLFLQLTTQER